MTKKVCVIGGGAAGIFSAICAAEAGCQVIVLEKSLKLLSKVRISGGGRCNVTHSAFDPQLLCQKYPRGNKELLGPFQHFQPKDTIAWFEKRGAKLKTEEDGRMFPVSNSSETIAETLLTAAFKAGVVIATGQKITKINRNEEVFCIERGEKPPLYCEALILATGSSPQGYEWAEQFGHTVIPPVPSLFTFNVPTSPFLDLSGITLQEARLTLPECQETKKPPLSEQGALLLTHFGFSGPAALKLSAFGARLLHAKNYHTPLLINWIPSESEQTAYEKLLSLKKKQKDLTTCPFALPQNLWKRLLEISKLEPETLLANIPHEGLKNLAKHLTASRFLISGKTTHKQEFVTAGGICLKEVDFKTMESRKTKGLYFAGEILDIDGVTGGFNFQNAWTTGYLAGKHINGATQ